MERRREDVRDQMKELSSNSKPALLLNPEETVEEEARQRRAAEREVRLSLNQQYIYIYIIFLHRSFMLTRKVSLILSFVI